MTIVVQVSSTATSNSFSPDILNWVCPDVPMAPLPLVINAIRDSAIDLCERALIWRQELQEILVLPPTSTTTTAAQATGDTKVSVADTTNFFAGDTITVNLDVDGSDSVFGVSVKWRGHVVSVSTTSGPGVIQLDGQLNDVVDIGATVTKLVYLYPMTMPTGTAFVKAVKVWLNDNPLDPISPDDLDNEFNNTDFGWVGVNWRTDVNLPTRFHTFNDNTIALTMPPSANGAGAMRILAALKPLRSSTTFPSWIYERYIETIAHGAKQRIMSIPKKPYSDPQCASDHGEKFNSLIGEARIRTARGATRAPLRSHCVYGLR